jgi:hypothetical protein
MSTVDRRALIRAAALGPFLLGDSRIVSAAAANRCVILHESGVIHSNEVFVVAALVVDNLESFSTSLVPIFEKHKFRIRLKYRSTVKYKAALFVDLVKGFQLSNRAKIYADVLLSPANDAWPADPDASRLTVERVYARLLNRIPSSNAPLVVLRKQRRGRDQPVQNALKSVMPAVMHTNIPDDKDRGTQFLTAVTGSIRRHLMPHAGVSAPKTAMATHIGKIVADKHAKSNIHVRTFSQLTF